MEAPEFYNPLRVFRAISPARHESMKLLFPPGNLSKSGNETIRNRNTSFVTEMSEFLSRIREREAENAAARLVCFVSEAKEMAAHSDLTRAPAVSGWFFRYFPSNRDLWKVSGIGLLFIRITSRIQKVCRCIFMPNKLLLNSQPNLCSQLYKFCYENLLWFVKIHKD